MCYQSRPFELFLNTRVLIRVWILHFNFQPVVYNRGECLPSSLAAHDWHQEFNCQVHFLSIPFILMKPISFHKYFHSPACSVPSKLLRFSLPANDRHQDFNCQVNCFYCTFFPLEHVYSTFYYLL